MRHSFKTGFSFGLTSGIITTLGLMVGLYASTYSKFAVINSKLVIIGGILTIAIADALSDAMGIHISEESENRHTSKEIWESTVSTFFCKFIFSTSFIIPILLLQLSTAIIVSIIWGLLLIGLFSYYIAKLQSAKSWWAILEHLIIALVVIVVTYYVGVWVSVTFNY